MRLGAVLLASASLAALPAAASAQNTVTNDVVVEDLNTLNTPADDGFVGTDDATMTNTQPVDQDDDDDFPWGLLGLLGLAGLLGLKRRDEARDVHVDARRDTRP
jgi:MYXO-CTERM domain-containing protein